MRIFRRLLSAVLLAWLIGCSDSVPTSPTILRCRLPSPMSFPALFPKQSTESRVRSRAAKWISISVGRRVSAVSPYPA